jgi:hypothetical protein
MSTQRFGLKDLVTKNRCQWDHPETRLSVRKNFARMVKCRTPALGAEVYSNGSKEYFFYHSCKSSSCPSCGWKATLNWQQRLLETLPDVPYTGMCFTIPGSLRPFFKENRYLLYDLPALAAEVIHLWAKSQIGIRIPLIIVLHTFGEKLNFHPHVHILAATGGLQESTNTWIPNLSFNRFALRKLWQTIVVRYLQRALALGLVVCHVEIDTLKRNLSAEAARPCWVINISRRMNKKHFLGYAARYARRPPIAQSRLIRFDDATVEFLTKDRKTKLVSSMSVFMSNLAEHVPDHYRHSVRCFGLWSPAGKHQTSSSLFFSLGQLKPIPSKPLKWHESIRKYFGRDPLVDEQGKELFWVRKTAPSHC